MHCFGQCQITVCSVEQRHRYRQAKAPNLECIGIVASTRQRERKEVKRKRWSLLLLLRKGEDVLPLGSGGFERKKKKKSGGRWREWRDESGFGGFGLKLGSLKIDKALPSVTFPSFLFCFFPHSPSSPFSPMSTRRDPFDGIKSRV